jgi:A/G-specific adenine glycosylase
MDLGATICLARIPRCGECPLTHDCPSHGIREAPARKQGSFEGSFRQRRAVTLRAVAESTRALVELDDEAVRSLERDGLVVVEEGVVALPSALEGVRTGALRTRSGRLQGSSRA